MVPPRAAAFEPVVLLRCSCLQPAHFLRSQAEPATSTCLGYKAVAQGGGRTSGCCRAGSAKHVRTNNCWIVTNPALSTPTVSSTDGTHQHFAALTKAYNSLVRGSFMMSHAKRAGGCLHLQRESQISKPLRECCLHFREGVVEAVLVLQSLG